MERTRTDTEGADDERKNEDIISTSCFVAASLRLGRGAGAITLTWVIYNLYLPQLLGQFGFPKQLAVGLLILENALAVVMEPLMGGY